MTADITVDALLRSAGRVWQRTLAPCLPLAMLAVLCDLLPTIWWEATGHSSLANVEQSPQFPTLVMLMIGCGVAYVYLLAVLIQRQRALAVGRDLPHARIWVTALRRMPLVLGALALAMLVAMFATLAMRASVVLGALMVVPLVFLLVCASALWPVMLFEGGTPLRAWVRSIRLVKPLWWRVCAGLVMALITTIVAIFLISSIAQALATVLTDNRPAQQALETALVLLIMSSVLLFLSALSLVIYSAASSSA